MYKRVIPVIVMLLSIVSCTQTTLKETEPMTPFCSKALKEQVDKLISMDSSGHKDIIDVFVYGKDSAYIMLSISDLFVDKHYYNVSTSYSNHIVHYGGLCDSLAREYINLDIFNKSDSSKCEDHSNCFVEPPLYYMFIARKDSLEKISPTKEDWLLIDAFYFEKYGVHAYHEEIPVPEPEIISFGTKNKFVNHLICKFYQPHVCLNQYTQCCYHFLYFSEMVYFYLI